MGDFYEKSVRQVETYINIEVVEPVTLVVREDSTGWTNSYTSYLIRIETNHWAFTKQYNEVRRRFSEFCWLRNKLVEHYPGMSLPSLPPKRYLRITKFNPKLVSARCIGLDKFIKKITSSVILLSDPALYLFLQTDLSITELDERLCEITGEKPSGPGNNHLPSSPTDSSTTSLARPPYTRSFSSGSSVYNSSECSSIPNSNATSSGSDFDSDSTTIYRSEVDGFPIGLIQSEDDLDSVRRRRSLNTYC